MRIVYHLGAHLTDDDRLLKCLLKNRDLLSSHGIVVPGPKKYRNLLRDTVIELQGAAASQDSQALILEQIMDEDRAERLILCWDSFLSLPPWAVKGTLYPAAGERVRAFSQIFPQIEPEFFLAIRNPATFLPALYDRLKDTVSRDDFLAGTDAMSLRWSEMIERVVDSNSDVPLTVWCDEDTPMIWPEVLRAVAGISPPAKFEGEDDLLATLMSPEGFTRLQAYIETHPTTTPVQRRKIVSAFLDKFALPERIEIQIDMPEWTADQVAEMTRRYEEDIARIMGMPEVTFIAP